MSLLDIFSTSLPRIAVFFGGCSSEYKVSLSSACAVLSHIDTTRYMPVPIGITQDGRWFLYTGPFEQLVADDWFHEESCFPVLLSPGENAHTLFIVTENAGQSVSAKSGDVSCVYRPLSVHAALPVLHGKNGEDGTLQGLLSLLSVPVIGCGTLASALCMDKDLAHRMAAALDVLVPASACIYSSFSEKEIIQAAHSLGYPLFIKPARAGSSFGITCVHEQEELLPAVQLAFRYDSKVLLEEKINGFEVGCAIMGRNCLPAHQLRIGEVDEIELAKGFFDYREKYTLETSQIHVPARIPTDLAAKIKATATRLYLGLDCDYFARIDLFVTPEGKIYFNEINTIPGFTSHSRFPNMMKSIGCDFGQLINDLLDMEMLSHFIRHQ